MVVTASSDATALSVNKALKRSCSGVLPELSRRQVASDWNCSGETLMDIVVSI